MSRSTRETLENAGLLGVTAAAAGILGLVAWYSITPGARAAREAHDASLKRAEARLERMVEESSREVSGVLVDVEYGWREQTIPAYEKEVPVDEPEWIRTIRGGAFPDDIVIVAAFGPPTEKRSVRERTIRHAEPYLVIESGEGTYVIEISGPQWRKDAFAKKLEAAIAAHGESGTVVQVRFPLGDIIPEYSKVECGLAGCEERIARRAGDTYLGRGGGVGQKPPSLIRLGEEGL